MADNKKGKNAATIGVKMELDDPKSFTKSLAEIKDQSNYLSRKKEKGLVNEQTGSAMVIRDNGQINLSAGKQAQVKLNPGGIVSEQSMESQTVTNRKSYLLDELVINHHKLNPAVYELTDMRELDLPLGSKGLVGNFTMLGTVLVKAWEPNLQRFMLIRRLTRMPLFSNILNVPDINTGLKVTDPLKIDEDILALASTGYQVNAEIVDNASLIGKEGQNRGASAGGGQVSNVQTNSNQKQGAGKASSEIIEKGIKWCIMIANDEDGIKHEYSQDCRQGPDYDCTSFISAGLTEGGLGCGILGGDTFDEKLATYGFRILSFGEVGEAGLQRGDILSSPGHVEWYIGNGQTVGAHGRIGKAQPDMISVIDYYDHGWTNVLRFEG